MIIHYSYDEKISRLSDIMQFTDAVELAKILDQLTFDQLKHLAKIVDKLSLGIKLDRN